MFSLFASAGLFAQCNLSVTNNTASSISLVGAEGDGYDCRSKVGSTLIATVEAGATFALDHHNSDFDNWVGIHITEPVDEPYPNFLAENCDSNSGQTYKIIWKDECTVSIN